MSRAAPSGLDGVRVAAMLAAMADAIIASKDRLTRADQTIGDGDHGVAMARAFAETKARLAATPPDSVQAAFRTAGMAIMSKAGGASGVVFGTMFLSLGAALGHRPVLDSDGLASGLRAALEAIEKRGGAKPGDKTMLDALAPAVEAIEPSAPAILSEAIAQVARAAEAGMEHTKTLVARTGKAKSLGERSLGHPDPGAVTLALAFGAMEAFVKAQSEPV